MYLQDYEIPQWQQDEVLERLEKYEKGEMSAKDWKDVKNNILKK